MAYAAVFSLNQTLEQISNPHPGPEQYKTPLQDQQIKSLQEKLNSLLEFMGHSWQKRSKEVRCLEREIRDAAYKVQDMIESHISKNFGHEGSQERQIREQSFLENFEIVADEIDSIKTKADKLKGLPDATDLHQSQRTSLPTGPSRLASSGRNAMVGFQNDLIEIMNRLTEYQTTRQVVPIVGMGGIGKTTLARNVYNNQRIKDHFDICGWVSISQEYREREALLSLLDSMKQLSAEMRQENTTAKLKQHLYQSLIGMTYLVVLDDVWTTEAWDSLRRIFPEERNGSRIMLTTRLLSVVDSQSSPHHMQLLNESDSWNLLCQEAFGKDSCPLELEEAGMEIAMNCKGLPLSLVVIGGHLSKANRTKDHWEYVAQDVKLVVTAEDANCSKILSLSYDYLPHYLKACFLYMGVFPEDDKIRVSKLIKLWAAEGFLKPVRGKMLEEVAEEYLGDLISRNLILIGNKSFNGKIKTCSIHDLLRDLCIRKAQKEKFFHVTDKDVKIFAEGMKYSRRLCIHPGIFPNTLSINSDNSILNPSIGSLPPIRSFFCSHFAGEIYESGEYGKLFPLLRVLDLGEGKVDSFIIGEIKLVHSRYLAFSCDGKTSIPKTLPDFLWYLETLIVDCIEVHLPEEIWTMPRLRHILCGMCYFPCPARSPIDGKTGVLGNLLTLSKVNSFSCTKELFERVPNLNKLGIWIKRSGIKRFSLGNVVNLPQLENLKIISEMEWVSVPMNFIFPPNIKKLTMNGCKIPWEHMTFVGLMPNLEVLKLLYVAFDGPEWEPTKGEFCKLKFLLLHGIDLVKWKADETHFTSLECLTLRQCFNLEAIPSSIGDIPTLQIIELDDASSSALISAQQIHVYQQDFGNNIQVRFTEFYSFVRLKRKEAEAEIIGGSTDDKLLLKATKQFCELLSADRTKEMMPGVVPRLVEFLERDDYPQLQCEAALAIGKISSRLSDKINMLIDHGAVPIMVRLLSSPKGVLQEQALEILGNFALDSTKSCDLILSSGVLMPLLALCDDKTKLTVVRNATQTLLNLCRGPPQLDQIKSAILPLAHLIHTDDEEVLANACDALSYLSSGEMDIKQAVIDAGVFPRLVELLLSPSHLVLFPVLMTVSSFIRDVDVIQIQVIIDKALPCLLKFLTQNYENNVKNTTCWIISFIIDRTKDHIQAVIEAGIISPLLQLFQNADSETHSQIAWIILLATMKGTNDQIKFLVHEGCIKPLCDHLVSPNEGNTIDFCLMSLLNILKVGEAEKNKVNNEDVNVFARMIDDTGGLQKIKNLQTHENSSISKLAVEILETYWQEEDDKQLPSGDAPTI